MSLEDPKNNCKQVKNESQPIVELSAKLVEHQFIGG